jgi:xanthine dehydrogenase small subunit
MSQTTFLLNDSLVETDTSAGTLLLDFLRNEARRTGTKEGCKEGDCGACAVMIGRVDEGSADRRIVYESVTSCLVPVAEVHGAHVVTSEGLRADPSTRGTFVGLNPAQASLVEFGGTQCGFCTPGIAVSLTWWMLGDEGSPTMDGFKRALSGHLCRCTGYASILRGGEALIEKFTTGEWSHVWAAKDRIGALVDEGLLPPHFASAREWIDDIEPVTLAPRQATDVVIAGGTDLYVQRGEHLPDSDVAVLNHPTAVSGRDAGLRSDIVLDGASILVGGLVTFEQFSAHPLIRERIPRIDEFMYLIASLQIRNRATLAGNIVNASPIGDMTNLLQALDTQLIIDDGAREVPLRTFYSGYKTYDLQAGELITQLRLRADLGSAAINFEKLSKRTCLDIATVCASACIFDDGGVIREACLTVGGVAATPLYLADTSQWLVGQTVKAATVLEAASRADKEIAPISDIRGSAQYKRLLNRQFIFAHFLTLYPDRVRFDELHQRSAS